MMNNTYSSIISQSERAWNFQWARTLFALEKRLNESERAFYLRKYSINMSSSANKNDSNTSLDQEDSAGQKEPEDRVEAKVERPEEKEEVGQFVPGLMIIKRASCTRAERRRHLVALWQVSEKFRGPMGIPCVKLLNEINSSSQDFN